MDNYLINLYEEDLDKPIYRIFSIKRLIELLTDKKLYMSKVNSWEDVYENFFMKCKFYNHGYDVSGLKEQSESIFGQCWSLTEDSDAMWRIYSLERNSVRIKTTLRKLVNIITYDRTIVTPDGIGVINDTFLGAVKYKNKDELDNWIKIQVLDSKNLANIIKDSLFIKRDCFQHESEIRVIYLADLNDDQKLVPYSIPTLISFDITPIELIDEIAFDPRVDMSFLNAYKDYIIKMFSFPENKITKSNLYDFKPFTFNIN